MARTDRNQQAYSETYDVSLLDLRMDSAYDRRMVNLRMERIRLLGAGVDVLDLGCGTGSYLVPNASVFRSAVGLDFSEKMLEHLRARFGGAPPPHVRILQEDLTSTSIATDSIDFVYSFGTLYYVADLEAALSEVARVLRPGGRALLEMGNRNSLHVFVWRRAIRGGAPWAEHHVRSYRSTRKMMAGVGLQVERWRAFQVLPFTGVTEGLRWLYPVAHPAWKRVFGVVIGDRMADEWLSSAPPMRAAAFRHLVELRKP